MDHQWFRRAGPSWLVALVVYSGWGLTTWFYASLPWWLVAIAGGLLVAWQGSLQHEGTHGQLAPRPWLNDLIASPPLSLWLPFSIYRQAHLAHHDFPILTDPRRDPESYYVERAAWQRCGPLRRGILLVNATLLGRMLIGPLLTIGQFLRAEAAALLQGRTEHVRAWLWHLPMVALVLSWTTLVCDMPIWAYLVLFVWPATSLTLVRSFAEHKAARTPLERTAIAEAGPFFALLFLNNNLHYAHHERPDLPWHRLPAYYRKHRQRLLEENGGLLYAGYREIFARFLLKPVDRPAHPFV